MEPITIFSTSETFSCKPNNQRLAYVLKYENHFCFKTFHNFFRIYIVTLDIYLFSYDHKTCLCSISSPRPKRLRETWSLSELNPCSEPFEICLSLMFVSCWKCRQTGLPILQKQPRNARNIIFPALHSFKQTQRGTSDVD